MRLPEVIREVIGSFLLPTTTKHAKEQLRKEAAFHREHDKRGEIDPREAEELAKDGN